MAATAAIAATEISSATSGCSISLVRLSNPEALSERRCFDLLGLAVASARLGDALFFFFGPAFGFLVGAMDILSSLIDHAHVGVFERNGKGAGLFPFAVQPAAD